MQAILNATDIGISEDVDFPRFFKHKLGFYFVLFSAVI